MKKVACKGELWGKCAALGDALRRASEAEARIVDLEERLRRFSEVLADAETTTAASCPNCSDTRHTTRSLNRQDVADGWVVCAQCYTKWRKGC